MCLFLTVIPFGYGVHVIRPRKRTFSMQIQHNFKVPWSFYFEGSLGAVLQNYCHFLQFVLCVNKLKKKGAK